MVLFRDSIRESGFRFENEITAKSDNPSQVWRFRGVRSVAVVWRRIVDGTTYEVRRAGNSIRLYTDRVFHSQWNASRPLMKSVWDCLTLPGFFLPAGKPNRVLLLGVGGGAAIRQLQMFFSPKEIVGIELDPVHIEVANTWFGVDVPEVSLVESDAVAWLEAYDGPQFDMVIEDLWGDIDGEAGRAVDLDREWAEQILRVTGPGGIIVVNYEGRSQLQDSFLAEHISRIRHRYIFEQTSYGNAVGVYTLGPRTRRHWRSRVEQCERLDATQRRVALSTWVSLCR